MPRRKINPTLWLRGGARLIAVDQADCPAYSTSTTYKAVYGTPLTKAQQTMQVLAALGASSSSASRQLSTSLQAANNIPLLSGAGILAGDPLSQLPPGRGHTIQRGLVLLIVEVVLIVDQSIFGCAFRPVRRGLGRQGAQPIQRERHYRCGGRLPDHLISAKCQLFHPERPTGRVKLAVRTSCCGGSSSACRR
jgi:hypothetical protein